MADVRPFRGLRFSTAAVPDLGAALAPPYDVIDGEAEAALLERSPYNIVRVELTEAGAREEGDYARAAETLREWRASGVLAQEDQPSFYVYSQEFEHGGRRLRRTALLARLRLEPWEAGTVRPHEATGRAAKEDRLQLFRHVRANVSPLFLLHRDPEGRLARLLAGAGAPDIEACTPDGERHGLSAITHAGTVAEISAALENETLYMADGHHRYETALAYRDERRAAAQTWTGEEPENYVLAALTAIEDPGIVLLPIHRLVRPPKTVPPDIVERLTRFFQVDDVTPKSYDGTALLRLLARLAAAGESGTAFGALGLEEGRLHLLTLADAAAARALMPEHSAAWQALDANVLAYAVLRETLGMSGEEGLEYTEDAERALRAVESGRSPLAFLLNPTRIGQILAVADAGERMPRKSTFFHPKLATGLVLYPFE